jgi:hypothetical protein
MNGLEVAKEILAVNPHLPSAYLQGMLIELNFIEAKVS